MVDAAFAQIRPQRQGSRILDGVNEAITMLSTGAAARRRVVLLISESRDRGSEALLDQTLERLQRANVTLYALTYSPFRTAWTVKANQRVGREDEEDSKPALQPGGMDLIPLLVSLGDKGKAPATRLLAQFTGGTAEPFTRQDALEQAISRAGEDLHSQYLLTFEDSAAADGQIHRIDVGVNRPGAVVRSRQGYWRGAEPDA